MATCFLFMNTCEDERFFSLRLNDEHELEAPFIKRSIEDILPLQLNAKTIVILPSHLASVFKLELPWFGERKAREALPFALEEQLAESVSDLHFAFDRAHYQESAYCVVVISKNLMKNWLDRIKVLGFSFDAITLDWFGLEKGEGLVTDTSLLVNQTDMLGAISPDLAVLYLANENQVTGYLFDDSLSLIKPPGWIKLEGSYAPFIAKRLAKKSILNLCQGDFKHDKQKQTKAITWYYRAAFIFGFWFIGFLSLHSIKIHQLTAQEKVIDQKIATIYHLFFPDATSVVNPKLRIESVLKSNSFSEQGAFWSVLEKLSAAFRAKEVTIKEISFHDQVVVVTLISQDFSTLDAFEEQMRQHHLQVKQIDAATHEKEVLATLELRV